jgi:hypothetical protein
MPKRFWWGSLLERNQLEFMVIDGRITLRCVIFIVVPCILKSKASHLPTDALFITLGKV